MKTQQGFSIAELLLAMSILASIATLTIPKVLYAQGQQKNNAIIMENVAAFSEAYQNYKLENDVLATTDARDLTPYFNYVTVDTSTDLDTNDGGFNKDCNANDPCLQMHNGSIILFSRFNFDDTANDHVIEILVDVDGRNTGNGDSIWFQLFYNGRISSEDKSTGYSHELGGPYGAGTAPSWFKWGGGG